MSVSLDKVCSLFVLPKTTFIFLMFICWKRTTTIICLNYVLSFYHGIWLNICSNSILLVNYKRTVWMLEQFNGVSANGIYEKPLQKGVLTVTFKVPRPPSPRTQTFNNMTLANIWLSHFWVAPPIRILYFAIV